MLLLFLFVFVFFWGVFCVCFFWGEGGCLFVLVLFFSVVASPTPQVVSVWTVSLLLFFVRLLFCFVDWGLFGGGGV